MRYVILPYLAPDCTNASQLLILYIPPPPPTPTPHRMRTSPSDKRREKSSDLERSLEAGNTAGIQGLKDDAGGMWMNDLKSLREDIT